MRVCAFKAKCKYYSPWRETHNIERRRSTLFIHRPFIYICQRDNLFSVLNNVQSGDFTSISARVARDSWCPWARVENNKEPLTASVTSAAHEKIQTSLYCDVRQGTRIRESKVHCARIGLSRCIREP